MSCLCVGFEFGYNEVVANSHALRVLWHANLVLLLLSYMCAASGLLCASTALAPNVLRDLFHNHLRSAL